MVTNLRPGCGREIHADTGDWPMVEFYLQNEYWFAAVQLFMAMLGMGATLAPKDFRDVLLEPKAVSVGVVIQIVAVPLVALGLIFGAGFPPAITVGIALIAAIPGGTVSNVFTHLGHGNTALSISITAVTTLACLATTPLVLQFLIAEHMPADFTMPVAQIAFEIGWCLLVPLLLGMLVLQFMATIAEAFSKWCVRISLFVIVLIVLGSLGAGRLDLEVFGTDNILRMVGFFAVLALMANIVPRLFGLSKPDRIAIEMEVVVRNVNLGLLINASLFPVTNPALAPVGNVVLLCLLLFGSLQLIQGIVLVSLSRRERASAT